MKRIFLHFILAASVLVAGAAQSVDSWRSYLSYYNTSIVAEGNDYIFAVANGSLYSYRKDDNSIRYYSKENGLNDTQILALAFNSSEKTFITAYSNGNIDLISENHTIYNIPFLMSSSNVQDKTVNAIFTHNEYAYLSANFGVIALNVKKKEIKETCFLDAPVSSLTILGDSIYACTGKGVLTAALSDNLINPNNWRPFSHGITEASETDSVLRLCTFGDGLCLLLKNRGVYWKSGGEVRRILNHNSLKSIKTENGKLLAFSASELYIFSSLTEYDKGGISNIADVSSLKDASIFWLATGQGGLAGIRRIGQNQYQSLASIVNADCPKYNYNAFMQMQGNKLYIAGGGRWSNRLFRPATVMAYDTDSLKWKNHADIGGAQDATSIAVDPADENHIFVSTWGEGVYEIKGNEIAAHYNHTNSALSTIYPGAAVAYNYIRAEGLIFDRGRNLWMTNSEVATTVVVRKADGTWRNFNYPDIANATLADKILIDANGYKWINLVRDRKSGIFVLDDKGTIDDSADDESYYYSSLSDVMGDIGAKEFTCIVEDLKGEIWIGTNRGPVYISVPSRGPKGTMLCQRIIRTDEYGLSDYFLKDERINAIAVDGGNRKWLGTESSGLYLVSENGLEVIHHFTSANSPLLSDRIESLAINHQTGEVFIGTSNGLVSFTGDAIKGAESYTNVYAYPNPVRPEDTFVIISGLMAESNVKITDSRGSLLFQGRSNGGMVRWNCRNQNNGKSVVSGVYFVLASSPGAAESVVAKIAVVR
ncbi:MAG: hypothetical protein LBH04_02335 [Tannerellaceae bacterium]|jgi:hypothetical protein|nr:hypothetical protein [Tannerellaceae bacterium]